MSRTYKDKPNRIRFPHDWATDRIQIFLDPVYVTTTRRLNLDTFEFEVEELEEPYVRRRFRYLEIKSSRGKQRKAVDTENHWMHTPSWWTRIMMNKPQRRRGHVWERKVLLEDLDETDPPTVGKKPHIYYW